MAKPSSKPEVTGISIQNNQISRSCSAAGDSKSYLERHTLIVSCCRQCKVPGSPTGGSWEHRYVCQPLGHAEHDDGDCEAEAETVRPQTGIQKQD